MRHSCNFRHKVATQSSRSGFHSLEQAGNYEQASEYVAHKEAWLPGTRDFGHIITEIRSCEVVYSAGEMSKVQCRIWNEIDDEHLTNYTVVNGKITQFSE